jgi:hypothetical protein
LVRLTVYHSFISGDFSASAVVFRRRTSHRLLPFLYLNEKTIFDCCFSWVLGFDIFDHFASIDESREVGGHPLFEWLLLELKLQVEQLVLVAEQLYLSFYSFQERFALNHEQLVHVMHALLVHDFLQLCFVKDGD